MGWPVFSQNWAAPPRDWSSAVTAPFHLWQLSANGAQLGRVTGARALSSVGRASRLHGDAVGALTSCILKVYRGAMIFAS